MNKKQVGKYASFFFVVAAVLVVVVYFVSSKEVYDRVLLLKYGVVGDGWVVKKTRVTKSTIVRTSSRTHDTFENYIVQVLFKDLAGSENSVEIYVSKDFFANTSEGGQIKILYDQNHPTNACVYLSRYEPLMMLIYSTLFTVVFLGGLVVIKRRFDQLS